MGIYYIVILDANIVKIQNTASVYSEHLQQQQSQDKNN